MTRAAPNPRTAKAWIIAIGGGALLWMLTAVLSGRQEAWDSSLYWTFAYPLSICLAGGLGYWVPARSWRWGLAVMVAQAVVLVFSADGFGLLPLGLIAFSILALPAIGVATFTARWRLRSVRR
ncbi:MAG: hypothetical protein J0H50_00725 [Xanthomonadales bacterium]|nr:hypothetical protein [Xanthomonadales bacterium]